MIYDIVKTAIQQKIEIIKSSNISYELHKFADDSIIGKIQKVAQKLALSNQKDLADYLSLTIKLATDGEIKNSKITYEYIMDKLLKTADERNQFESLYNKEHSRAKSFNVENIEKVALLSTIQKLGVKLE